MKAEKNFGRANISIRCAEVEKEYRPYLKKAPNEMDGIKICPLSIHINNWEYWEKNQQSWNSIFQKMDDFMVRTVFDNYKIDDNNWLFFQTGDCYATLPSLKKFLVLKESSTVGDLGMYYHAEKLDTKPIEKCEYLLGFQGDGQNHPIRKEMIRILSNRKDSNIVDNNIYYYYANKNTSIELKKSFEQKMNDCAFILCPRGSGIATKRFFETLAAGRIPILISDHYELPLRKYIDYSKFVVRLPENDMKNIDNYLKKIDIKEASKLARQTHQDYFSDIKKFLEYSISMSKSKNDLDPQPSKQRNSAFQFLKNLFISKIPFSKNSLIDNHGSLKDQEKFIVKKLKRQTKALL